MQFIRGTSTAALFLLFGTIVPAYAQQDHQDEKQSRPEKRRDGQQKEALPPAQQQRSQGQPQQPEARGRQQQKQQREQPDAERAQQPRQQRGQETRQQEQRQSAQQPGPRREQQPQLQQQPQRQQVRQNQQQQQPLRTRQQAAEWQQQRGWLRQGGWQGQGTWQQSRAQRWDNEHRTWGQRGGYGGYYIPQSSFSLYFGRQHWFRMHSRPTIYMGYPRFSYSGFSFLLLDPWPEYWAENWYATDDVYIDYDDGYYIYNRSYPSVRLAITVAL